MPPHGDYDRPVQGRGHRRRQGDSFGTPKRGLDAALFLTTEAVVVDKPEEEAPAGHPGGGMDDY